MWSPQKLTKVLPQCNDYGVVVAVFLDQPPENCYPKVRATLGQQALPVVKRSCVKAEASAAPEVRSEESLAQPVNELRPLLDAPGPETVARGGEEVNIGPRPDGVTEAQWAALRRLHWGLGGFGRPSCPTRLHARRTVRVFL